MGKEYLVQGDPFPSFLDGTGLFLKENYQLIWLAIGLLILFYWKKDDFFTWLQTISPPKTEPDLESTLSEQELFERAEELRLARLRMQDDLKKQVEALGIPPAKQSAEEKRVEKLRQYHPTNPSQPKPPPPARRDYNPLMGHGGGGTFRSSRNFRPSGGGG
eukprot:TRINITY_DN2794_c0_g1_i1.p1 TRINITY_DN2794_c0_g1~~TRINITY_DN2794_c0_g1_i1.p1  ORF type:complete len:161 (+),score=43.32 TRINITY_DN2794_c0_g1_i1:129-611(+)